MALLHVYYSYLRYINFYFAYILYLNGFHFVTISYTCIVFYMYNIAFHLTGVIFDISQSSQASERASAQAAFELHCRGAGNPPEPCSNIFLTPGQKTQKYVFVPDYCLILAK